MKAHARRNVAIEFFDVRDMLEPVRDTLPDMFYMPESAYLLYRQLVDNGMLYDLGSIYDQCAGDYMKFVNGTYNTV